MQGKNSQNWFVIDFCNLMINTNYGWSTLIQVILHFMGFWLPPHTPHLQHTTDILLFYLSTEHVLLCELDKRNVLIIKKEGNVSFYNTLNTIYLYGVAHMVKDNSDNQKNNPLLPFWGYSLWLTARDLLHASYCRLDSINNGLFSFLFYASCGALAGTRNMHC